MTTQHHEVEIKIATKDAEYTIHGELTTDQSDPVAVARDVRDALKRGLDTYREIESDR